MNINLAEIANGALQENAQNAFEQLCFPYAFNVWR